MPLVDGFDPGGRCYAVCRTGRCRYRERSGASLVGGKGHDKHGCAGGIHPPIPRDVLCDACSRGSRLGAGHLAKFCTVPYRLRMSSVRHKGAEEARNQLPDLLDAAEKGRSTIITRHGRPVAALIPVESYGTAARQQSLTPLAGSGSGLWSKDSRRTLRKLRDEWSR